MFSVGDWIAVLDKGFPVFLDNILVLKLKDLSQIHCVRILYKLGQQSSVANSFPYPQMSSQTFVYFIYVDWFGRAGTRYLEGNVKQNSSRCLSLMGEAMLGSCDEKVAYLVPQETFIYTVTV